MRLQVQRVLLATMPCRRREPRGSVESAQRRLVPPTTRSRSHVPPNPTSPRARRGAIPICRATSRTSTRAARRSSVPTSSPAARSKRSPARNWRAIKRADSAARPSSASRRRSTRRTTGGRTRCFSTRAVRPGSSPIRPTARFRRSPPRRRSASTRRGRRERRADTVPPIRTRTAASTTAASRAAFPSR